MTTVKNLLELFDRRFEYEGQALYGRTDHRYAQPARVRRERGEYMPRYGHRPGHLYRWKSKYGGMDVSDAKRLRELELENGKLKKLLAEAALDNAALKEVVSKKW